LNNFFKYDALSEKHSYNNLFETLKSLQNQSSDALSAYSKDNGHFDLIAHYVRTRLNNNELANLVRQQQNMDDKIKVIYEKYESMQEKVSSDNIFKNFWKKEPFWRSVLDSSVGTFLITKLLENNQYNILPQNLYSDWSDALQWYFILPTLGAVSAASYAWKKHKENEELKKQQRGSF
jgi:hypothetical protein